MSPRVNGPVHGRSGDALVPSNFLLLLVRHLLLEAMHLLLLAWHLFLIRLNSCF